MTSWQSNKHLINFNFPPEKIALGALTRAARSSRGPRVLNRDETVLNSSFVISPIHKIYVAVIACPPFFSLSYLSIPSLSLNTQEEKALRSGLTSPVALEGGITGLSFLNLTPLLITCWLSLLAPSRVLS